MFFVMSLRLLLHNIASSSSFFRFRSDFLARISYFKFLEFKEFNKTIIPFALVGYETGYSQLGAMRLVGYLRTISYPTRAHGLIVKYHAKARGLFTPNARRNAAIGKALTSSLQKSHKDDKSLKS